MIRHGTQASDKRASKKALRRAGRRIAFRGLRYVSTLHRRRMSRASNSTCFVDGIFSQDIHVKRVQSLAGGVLGVLHGGRVVDCGGRSGQRGASLGRPDECESAKDGSQA